MTRTQPKLVVVGHGAAGLAAALSAAEQARSRGVPIDITVLEKSREDEAGGNTRWSPSYMRLEAPDRIAPGFEEEMHAVSGGLADRSYFRTLAGNAVQTIGWLQAHGVEFIKPVYLPQRRPGADPAGRRRQDHRRKAACGREKCRGRDSLRMRGEGAADGERRCNQWYQSPIP